MKYTVIFALLFLSSCSFYVSMDDKPQSEELMSHGYYFKEDVFLHEAEHMGPYYGMTRYEYLVKPPGYGEWNPQTVDQYLKYGHDWMNNDPREFGHGGNFPNTVVGVIKAGTQFRVCHVEQKNSFEFGYDICKVFISIEDGFLVGKRIYAEPFISLTKDLCGEYRFVVNEKYVGYTF